MPGLPTVPAMPAMRYEIDGRSGVPFYRQLADQLRAQIESEEILPDDPLPSLNRLVQETGLDIKTVQHAVQVLVDAQLAYRVPGRGTYATPPEHRKQP